MLPVGIDALEFYTPHYCLELKEVALDRGLAADHFDQALGQNTMAVPPPDEDIVTMAANAGYHLLERTGREGITQLLLGTESGIDQSKASAAYGHRLLGLSNRCRVTEFKQACYGGTAALQLAAAHVRANPCQKALVLAADIARYGLGTAGEATQGGGAVAMLVSANPRLLVLDPAAGYYTEDVMDFWRPNYRNEALVDGKASVRVYIKALQEAYNHYAEQSDRRLDDFAAFCYHLPFSRMAEMAHLRLLRSAKLPTQNVAANLAPSLIYNRRTGNSYAASLYVALTSLLDHRDDLDGKALALFSYGSGCMAEFFSGSIVPGYRDTLGQERRKAMLASRCHLDLETYRSFYSYALPTDGSACELPQHQTGHFRLTGIRNHQRQYTAT